MIIALCGKKGSGKSSLAKALREELNGGASPCHILSLALPIKNLVHKAYGEPPRTADGSADKEAPAIYPYTFRGAYQKVGQGLRHILDEKFWLRTWERSAEQLAELGNKRESTLIVDDVRYHNEVDFFRNKGAMMVRLLRNPWAMDPHPSEQEMVGIPMEKFHVVLSPTATVEENKALVMAAWTCFKGRSVV